MYLVLHTFGLLAKAVAGNCIRENWKKQVNVKKKTLLIFQKLAFMENPTYNGEQNRERVTEK